MKSYLVKKSAVMICALFVSAASASLISGCSRSQSQSPLEALTFQTEYQAVFMDNGQVYFGKIEKAASAHPVLREVYYIGVQRSEDGKQTQNILLKRGNEWHGPEYMVLSASHITMMEPVSANSRVAELIKQLKEQKPAEQPAK